MVMKMVSILTEPAYSESMWCKEIYNGLTSTLTQKRIPYNDITDTISENTECFFVIASDYNWIKAILHKLNLMCVKPILICNQAETIQGCDYSCVCSDVSSATKHMLSELKTSGKIRVALYGVNTTSISDMGRIDGFFAFKDDSFDDAQIFVNNGSLKACFEEFYPLRSSFDAVICLNDLAAVSLAKNLKEKSPETLKYLKILSCTHSKISDYYRDIIDSVDMCFEQYGKAAVFIYEKLKQHPYLSGMTVTVGKSSYCETKESKPINLNDITKADNIYSDKEIRDLLLVEHILNISNDTDKMIIAMLTKGVLMADIAQSCFLTEGGVKYRINRILNKCKISNKSELVTLIKNYLPRFDGSM